MNSWNSLLTQTGSQLALKHLFKAVRNGRNLLTRVNSWYVQEHGQVNTHTHLMQEVSSLCLSLSTFLGCNSVLLSPLQPPVAVV